MIWVTHYLLNRNKTKLLQLLKRYGSDLLFWYQIFGATWLMIPLMIRNWNNVEGVSLSFFILLSCFCLLQLWLAYPAYRSAPTKQSTQTVVIYTMWSGLTLLHIILIWLRGLYRWDWNDSFTTLLTLSIAGAVIFIQRLQGIELNHPIIKSQLAMAIRAVPQLFLAIKIALNGAGGMPGISVLFGNLNIWSRISHLQLSKEQYSDQVLVWRWLIRAELVNALSWGAVTSAWIIRWLYS